MKTIYDYGTHVEIKLALMALNYALEIGGSYAREEVLKIINILGADIAEFDELLDQVDPAMAGQIAALFEVR
jgi:hypothetical protein